MSELFESIRKGLNEAIEHERGALPARVDKVMIAPLCDFTASEIKEIRVRHNMTQRLFAEALGVSIKTVESWEAGINKPSGIASRMLNMLKQDNNLLERYSIIVRNVI